MAFHPGQLVVCVDDHYPDTQGFNSWPLKKGSVYTITRVHLSDMPGMFHGVLQKEPRILVCLAEVRSIRRNGKPHDGGFHSARFRPLDETRLDIFRQMLVSPPKVEELSPLVFSDQEPS